MKKLFLFSLSGLAVGVVAAQTTAKPKPTVKNPTTVATAKPVLKSITDSVGYALGVNIGSSLKMQEMTAINADMISKGISDILKNKTTLLDENTAFSILTSYSQKIQEQKSKSTIAAGEEFLRKNKERPGVKTTASGLQYEVITEGTGPHPTAADTFVVHYRGTLIDGTKFDASYDRNEPLTYPMTRVIPGWTEGLQLMSVGSKYKFYIPYNLGYGLQGNPPAIPGGSALIFDLELLDIKKAN